MYDFKLNKNEQILLISDNTIIKNKDNLYTTILTSDRLLILDYPSSYHNSSEELRILGRMNYIKKKEIKFETSLKEVKSIAKEKDYNKILFKNDTSILIKDNEVINKLKEVI